MTIFHAEQLGDTIVTIGRGDDRMYRVAVVDAHNAEVTFLYETSNYNDAYNIWDERKFRH